MEFEETRPLRRKCRRPKVEPSDGRATGDYGLRRPVVGPIRRKEGGTPLPDLFVERDEKLAVAKRFVDRRGRRQRRVQERDWVEVRVQVETQYGPVRIKVGEAGSFAPEYDDCRKLALTTGAPLRQIIAEAGFSFLKQQHPK